MIQWKLEPYEITQWSILFIPPANMESIPKGTLLGALLQPECFKMWLSFVGPCEMTTHPANFATYLFSWQPTSPGVEAPGLSLLVLEMALPLGYPEDTS